MKKKNKIVFNICIVFIPYLTPILKTEAERLPSTTRDGHRQRNKTNNVVIDGEATAHFVSCRQTMTSEMTFKIAPLLFTMFHRIVHVTMSE